MKHKMCAQLRYLRSQRSFGWWVVILCCAAARRSEACISPILTIQCYQESPDCSIFFEKPNTDCGGHIFCQLFFLSSLALESQQDRQMLVSAALLTRQTKVKVFPAFHHHHLFFLPSDPPPQAIYILAKGKCLFLEKLFAIHYFQSNIRKEGRRGSAKKRNLFKGFRFASQYSTAYTSQPKWPPLSFNNN